MTLRGRTIIAAAFATLIAVVVLGSALDVLVAQHLRRDLDRNLRTRAVDVAQLAASAPALVTAPGTLDSQTGALVAVDIVAAESQNGTLKTILTRSRNRGQIYAAKALAAFTYTALVIVAMGVVGVVAASIEWGFNPLTSLSGTTVSAGHALGLLGASLAIYAWPMAGIAGFGLFLSTLTRNSAAAVVGTLMWALFMQLLGVLPGTEAIRPYLLGEQFQAWHGFLRTPADWTPVVRALWVCALYVTIPLFAGYLVFVRRDVAGE